MSGDDRPATLGMLVLDTRFPRIDGDGGNPATWPFPVLFQVVEGAFPERVVGGDSGPLLAPFTAAAAALAAAGAHGITTSCGFLVLHQAHLARAVDVPVATSSLLQLATVQALLPAGRRAGVVTVSAEALGPAHLRAAGAPGDTPVAGLAANCELQRVLLGNEPVLDVARSRDDVIAAARSLLACHPEVGAIVLECTNMPPYAAAVAAATGVPVYDFYSFVRWFHAGLRPRAFAR